MSVLEIWENKGQNQHLQIAGPGQHVRIVQEPARAQETLVAGQLAHNLGVALGVPVVDVVHGAHVVHAPASHKVPGLGKGHTHDPGRPQRDDLHLVPGPGVPDDELAVERTRDAVPRVPRKVHRVDLVDVTLEELFRRDAHLRCVPHVRAFVLQRAVGGLLLLVLRNEGTKEMTVNNPRKICLIGSRVCCGVVISL